MKKTFPLIAFAVLSAALMLSFQNCSKGGSDAAPSCPNTAVLKNLFPTGKSFSIPAGVSNTPYSCLNQSSYTTATFSSADQSLTLSGGGSKKFDLATGGGGCAGNKTGGDSFAAAAGGTVEVNTDSTAKTIEIVNSPDISCTLGY